MNFWKRKLADYLHDPPSKCLDIPTHGDRSDVAFRQAGFTDSDIGEYFAHADHAAAAADRLPFPGSRAAKLSCAFDGIRNAFRHPLSGEPLSFDKELPSVERAFEGETAVQPILSEDSLAALKDEAERWQARFFAHWRLWPRHAVQHDYRLGLLPADTRIPDHTIWTHMQVVSALGGCVHEGKWQPAFLKFQLGPVQDFIAAARSIRDLWSGSYLLSWLMAAGLKALSAEIGPDAVVFPNLREQPLFDLHWREELWQRVSINDRGNVWDSLGWRDRDLLTPNLPNVFLAVVPADRARALAETVKQAIAKEWRNIAGSVWRVCQEAGLTADEAALSEQKRHDRFFAQVDRFLSLSWQTTPWPRTPEAAMDLAEGFGNDMPVAQARARIQAVVDMAEKQMPSEHRDGRYYVGGSNGPKKKLNNIGLGWSVILALNSWELDAVRQARDFAGRSGGWEVGAANNKDALTGREEAVAGGKEWVERAKAAQEFWPSLFKHEDWLGAATLIKRVWHRAYLAKGPWELPTDSHHFPMPNTRGVAAHQPEVDCADDETGDAEPLSEKYFAVLAFDGDEIGKWVSGEKTPTFATQLADYRDGSGNPGFGAKPYFDRPEFAGFLKQRRPLSPSYHLQFSEALGNFARLCARPIVEAFDGRLIYAGGDDVLALLPADSALDCGRALRMAFRGDLGLKSFLHDRATVLQAAHERRRRQDSKSPEAPYYQKLAAESCLLEAREAGFLRRLDLVDQRNVAIPFIVPGPEADCSVGIAIAHFKSPLQDAVRAAQAAEKRAKRRVDQGGLGRSAVALTLMKRSGEIIEWGSRWNGGGLEAFAEILKSLADDVVSAKFPHRIEEFVQGYRADRTSAADSFTPEIAARILRHEIGLAADRQRGDNYDSAKVTLVQDAVDAYLNSLAEPDKKVNGLIGLCRSVAFAHRTSVD